MAAVRTRVEHVYNDDLLANAGDIDKASGLYEEIVHVLHDPELIEQFNAFNSSADKAKRRRHLEGYWAVGLGTLSLMTAAALLVLHTGKEINDWPWGTLENVASIVAALAGILSMIFAFGVMRQSSKEHWLCARLMSERLRQFHFQTLIFRLPQILASARPGGDKAQYLRERKRWMARFQERFDDKLPAELVEIIEASGLDGFALHPAVESFEEFHLDSDDPILAKVFEAYEHLRITHQLQFATLKLGDQSGIWPSLPRPQARRIAFLSFFFIGILLVLDIVGAGISVVEGAAPWIMSERVHGDHAGKAAAPAGEARAPSRSTASPTNGASPGAGSEAKSKSWHIPQALHVAALGLAILVLALRALDEGLKPDREAERYIKYRSAILRVRERFLAAKTPVAKLEVMRGMERMAYDEMCDFLRTHHEARFVM